MQLPRAFDDLIEEATKLELYTKLVNQLNKDFMLAKVDLNFDENILPTSLKFLLHEAIYNLIHEKFTEYLNLLYIIDVSEKKVKLLDDSDLVTLSEQVTFLILQREWQKVWYRANY